jgi:predicted aspartyl protease
MKTIVTSLLILASLLLSPASQSAELTPYQSLISKSEDYVPIQLIYDKSKNYLLLPVMIDGRQECFLLDTGAGKTSFTLESAKRLKLKLTSTKRSAQGVGGHSLNYTAKVKNFSLGGQWSFPALTLDVAHIPALNVKYNYNGIAPVGILGTDILQNIKAIIDFNAGYLFIPRKGSSAIPETLKKSGYEKENFVGWSSFFTPVVQVSLGKKKALMLFDTGAKSTVIDSTLAKEVKLKRFTASSTVSGLGGEAKSEYLYIPTMKFIGSEVTKKAAIMMDLSALSQRYENQRFMGIVGADLMFPTKMIIDYGNQCIFTKKGVFKANDLGIPGPLSKNLLKVVEKSPTILLGSVHSIIINEETIQNAEGKKMRAVTLVFNIKEVLRGKGFTPKKESFTVYIPEEKNMDIKFKSSIYVSSQKILILPKDYQKVKLIMDRVFIKSSSVRDAHLKLILKKHAK